MTMVSLFISYFDSPFKRYNVFLVWKETESLLVKVRERLWVLKVFPISLVEFCVLWFSGKSLEQEKINAHNEIINRDFFIMFRLVKNMVLYSTGPLVIQGTYYFYDNKIIEEKVHLQIYKWIDVYNWVCDFNKNGFKTASYLGNH